MTSLSTTPVETINIEEIMELIPHRYPFLLVDKVIDIIPGVSATGIKNVTFNEQFFQGHFPGRPIMPGVLIIEALAQCAGLLVMRSANKSSKDSLVYFMSIDEAKFRKPVVPGDTLHLKVTCLKGRGNIWKFKGQAFVGEKIATEAIFTAMIAER